MFLIKIDAVQANVLIARALSVRGGIVVQLYM